MADGLHDLQRDGLFREEAEGPVGESWRWCPQPQSYDLGFVLSVDDLATDAPLGVAMERDLKAVCHEALPHVFDGLRATVERVSNLGISLAGTIHIGLEQNPGTQHLLRRDPLLFDQTVQNLPLGIGEANNILFRMAQPSSVGRTLPQITRERYPH